MLLSIQSTNDDYSKIRAQIHIPWSCKYVKYCVNAINLKANILFITNDDYITIDSNEQSFEIRFEDSYNITQTTMLTYLKNNTSLFSDVSIVNKHLTITPAVDFQFTHITHRARLITGLLNAPLNTTFEANKTYTFDIPILDYANKLYLISKQGQSIQSNIGSHEYTPSVISNIDAFIRDGVPVIVNFELMGKPIKNTVNVDSFKTIELQLVDFMYQPVILHSPMFITMKIKPVKTPQMILDS